MRILLALTLWLNATLPAHAALPCPPGFNARTRVELYFGRNIGETLGVSTEAWAAFVDEEITPRFPDGLSVIDVQGQWKDTGSGRIVREPGKLVILLVAADGTSSGKIGDIVALYKNRHSQQSVLITQQDVCAAF